MCGNDYVYDHRYSYVVHNTSLSETVFYIMF